MQTQLGHQFLGRGEPPEITDGSNHRQPDHRIDSGDGHQVAHHRIGERLDRQLAVCGGEFAAEKVQLPQQRSDCVMLVLGQLLTEQPPAARRRRTDR